MNRVSAERIDKTERLLNLTLALLATKRPMTKAEIFEQIPGYSGSPESMERMFERDKDELRDLGITVEVLPTDAYFNDEQGYQIIPRDFFLEDISFTYEESLWLAIATNLLHEASPKAGARQGLQKLITVGQVGGEEFFEMGAHTELALSFSESLQEIWRSIRERRVLSFTYSTSKGTKRRAASPILLTSRLGNWYLVAIDSDDKQVKTFRIDRITDVSVEPRKSFHDPAPSFHLDEFLSRFKGDQFELITIKLHNELSSEHPLIAYSSTRFSGERVGIGSIVHLENLDSDRALELILWAGDAIEVLEPVELRNQIIDILKEIVEVHS